MKVKVKVMEMTIEVEGDKVDIKSFLSGLGGGILGSYLVKTITEKKSQPDGKTSPSDEERRRLIEDDE
jgi:hypothetical protein